MAFPVNNIRAACAKKNTTIKQLEKDLGIGNGVIAKWEKAKGSPPYSRIVAIAAHLGVSVSDLTGEEQKEKPASVSEGELSEEERKFIEWYRTQATDKEKAIVMTIVDSHT